MTISGCHLIRKEYRTQRRPNVLLEILYLHPKGSGFGKALIRSVGCKTDACENKIPPIFNGLITNRQDFIFAGVGLKTNGPDQGLIPKV